MKRLRSTKVWALLGLLLLGLFGLDAAATSYRSDAALQKQFSAHEADFEKLVQMAEEDIHLVRIARDFTWLDTDVSWPRKDVGLSEDRWNEYRRLFRSAGIPDGISKDVNPPKILFPIVARGFVPASQEKGIAFSSVALGPVLKSLDKKPPDELYDKRGYVVVFKPIKDHWYIYYQEF